MAPVPSHDFFCTATGAVSNWRESFARHYFHADNAHLLLDRHREKILGKAVIIFVGGVQTHQDGIEGEAPDALHERVGTKASGHPEMPRHLLVARLAERFYGSALAENLIYFIDSADVMKLPGIEVIGIQQLQRFF
jgi:hypothetical protein